MIVKFSDSINLKGKCRGAIEKEQKSLRVKAREHMAKNSVAEETICFDWVRRGATLRLNCTGIARNA